MLDQLGAKELLELHRFDALYKAAVFDVQVDDVADYLVRKTLAYLGLDHVQNAGRAVETAHQKRRQVTAGTVLSQAVVTYAVK